MSGSVHLVCDYAPGDLAWSEILAALSDQLPSSVRLIQTAVGSFDTIATGFIVAQLSGRGKTLLFGNCAPRKDSQGARADNEGEGLVYAKLQNGSELLVVNSGYSLSFVKPHITELHSTKASSKGSQFRSRDFFPGVLLKCLQGDQSFLDQKLEADKLPNPPSSVVAYIDSFGNMKSSIRTGDDALKDLKEGTRVKVQVADRVRYATVTNGSFNVPEGELAFAPGSSGYDKPFWELFKRGSSAWHEFSEPHTGAPIHIEVVGR